jgi:hypothetical protein
MGKYSTIINKKVLPWRFKKRKVDTLFYVGDFLLGQIFKMKNSWSALPDSTTEAGLVSGFRTRVDACQYLIIIFESYLTNYNKSMNNLDNTLNKLITNFTKEDLLLIVSYLRAKKFLSSSGYNHLKNSTFKYILVYLKHINVLYQ